MPLNNLNLIQIYFYPAFYHRQNNIIAQLFQKYKALTSLVHLESFKRNFQKFKLLQTKVSLTTLKNTKKTIFLAEQKFDLKAYCILAEKLLLKRNMDLFQTKVRLNSKLYNEDFFRQFSSILNECVDVYSLPTLSANFLRIHYMLMVQGCDCFKDFLKSKEKFGVIEVLVLLRYLDTYSLSLTSFLKAYPQTYGKKFLTFLSQRIEEIFSPCSDTLSSYILSKSLESLEGMHTLPAGIRVQVKENPGVKNQQLKVSSYVHLSVVPLKQLREKPLYSTLSVLSKSKIQERVQEGFVKKVTETVRNLIVNQESLISSLQSIDTGKMNENILILQVLKQQLHLDLEGLQNEWGEQLMLNEAIEIVQN